MAPLRVIPHRSMSARAGRQAQPVKWGVVRRGPAGWANGTMRVDQYDPQRHGDASTASGAR